MALGKCVFDFVNAFMRLVWHIKKLSSGDEKNSGRLSKKGEKGENEGKDKDKRKKRDFRKSKNRSRSGDKRTDLSSSDDAGSGSGEKKVLMAKTIILRPKDKVADSEGGGVVTYQPNF